MKIPEGMKFTGSTKVKTAIENRLKICKGYCPCVPDSIGDEKYKCPCVKARVDKKCCCKLFVKE